MKLILEISQHQPNGNLYRVTTDRALPLTPTDEMRAKKTYAKMLESAERTAGVPAALREWERADSMSGRNRDNAAVDRAADALGEAQKAAKSTADAEYMAYLAAKMPTQEIDVNSTHRLFRKSARRVAKEYQAALEKNFGITSEISAEIA